MSFSKRVIKYVLVKILYYSGLPLFFREVIQKRKVTILVCHDPEVQIAENYFKWLSKHYNIISLERYLSVRTGKETARLPPKSLIITLDDGHIGNYKLLPLVKKYKVPLTIFLCSGIVGTNRHFWFRYSGLPSSSEPLKVIAESMRLKTLSEVGYYREKEFAQPQALNKEQIRQMKEYINFQGHTVFHPCLSQCSDEESRFEIEQSKRQLEEEFNLPVNAIAFPNSDFSDRDIRFAQTAGYSCALTVGHGFNNDQTGLFRLRRFSVGDRDSVQLLAIKAAGVWAYLKYTLKSLTKAQ